VEAHATFEALLDAADALTVVVPTPAHFEVARAALARGKHLLIEKPITTTLAEADELLALARANGALVQTGTSSGSTGPSARRCRTSTRRGSSRATGSRRSRSAAPTSRSCST
jgi:predicted dehydrogenase